nr:T9SS type A sorting domain-containing protein [Bacteroidota bacterium]
MTVAIWSPTAGTPMRLKVEAASDPTISVETETLSTVADAWEVITFDFSNEAPGTEPLSFDKSYNKASIFFNFGTTGAVAGEQTYYWDDMEFSGGGVEPKPYLALDVQDNFENDGYATITDWKFQDPDLVDLTIVADPANATNHVANYTRSGSFEYTNAQFILDHRMDLTERNKFEINVYFPSTNAYDDMLTPTAALKLQNSLLGGEAWTTQTEVKLTVEQYDTWVTLEFDFTEAAARDDYDQMVVQLGGEGHFVPAQFYFDDIVLTGASGNGNLTFNPVNGTADIELSISPTLSFSVPVVKADGSEVLDGDIADIVTFKESDASGADVSFAGTINAAKTVITIDPVSDLADGQAYYLALNDAVIRYQNADLIPGQSATFTTGGGVGPKPYLAADVQDNFEDDGYATITDWKFQDSPDLVDLTIGVDPTSASNHVADYNRSGAFEWTNAQFILDHRMDLTVRNKFEIKVYFPSTNAYDDQLTPTAALKLQNSLLGGEAWTTQTEVKLTVEAYDSWVTLEFDFSEVAERDDYDQVVVQLGGEGHFVPGMFYFDDIYLVDPSSISENRPVEFAIFPNPVADEFVIAGIENITSVKVYNMQGQVVILVTGDVSTVNVSQLAGGVYQVVAETKSKIVYTAKMLKK